MIGDSCVSRKRTPPPLLVLLGTAVTAVLLSHCQLRADEIDYLRDVKPLLERKCYACHGALAQESGLRLDTAAFMRAGGDSGPVVDLADVEESLLLERVMADPDAGRMPPEGEPLTKDQIELIRNWLRAGAAAPDDEAPQTDPLAHWAFQPLDFHIAPPATTPPAHPVDAFVRRRLNEHGLKPNGPADATTLVRRMFLDLHGLPPTPEELSMWSGKLVSNYSKRGHSDIDEMVSFDEAAVGELIDFLLASPRYGERHGQYWLDLVRYADTHGFEVNTPRPHAWRYRDYVIQALNADKPYDEFIFDQLAGDVTGEDAATGFLVAAAVLLPGQIGKDAESIRLARQDALDEIIVGTTASFLGLTVGCARCHDHKFDPVSQADYYAMQAFFAGVEYGDREIRDAQWDRKQAEIASLSSDIADLQSRLREHQPFTTLGRTFIIDDEDPHRVTSLKTKNGHGVNPDGAARGERADTGDQERMPNLSRGRYTWWDNVPGEDVFTWNPEAAGTFRLWISWGVHGSGVHTRDARYVLDRDGDLETRDDQVEVAQADQYYFAGQSEGESRRQPLWSGLKEVGVFEFSPETRLLLRGGETGTGITADVIVLQEVSPDGLPIAHEARATLETSANVASTNLSAVTPRLPRTRNPVNAGHNLERFPAREARFVRFTTLETIDENRHEPCLDELEIFSAEQPGRNVAASQFGTIATSSGNYSETGQHQLPHIHDGKYGNDRSWISNQRGGGWVQLEFPETQLIDRVEWGRDREGQFKDRLPVRYRIETSLDGTTWTLAAHSDDRLPLDTPVDEASLLERYRPPEAKGTLTDLLGRLRELERRKRELEQPQLAYAGIFGQPEETYVLSRGNPEQRLERIGPRSPTSLGSLTLSTDSDERERRIALARWIASEENPLTARVMVNRIWQSHFGIGLVETASDFGLNGARPSHSDLLDWLAAEFIRRDWSLKEMHRLILTSKTYQQSSHIDPDAQAVDADGRLLWRYLPRRLEAEAIRDSVLQLSGRLNLQMGGPGFDFFQSRGGLSGFPPLEEFGESELRRMIYAHKVRMERVPVFGAFDCPDAGQATPTRSRSTTAIQALNLLNSPFMHEQSVAFAERVSSEAGPDPHRQVELAFHLAVGRFPSEAEANESQRVVEAYGMRTLCRVLLNSSEFLFIP
jgi:hypothetical protein